MKFSLIFFCCLLKISLGEIYTFPKKFQFGAATAAYQCEGGWNVDDKIESIWDNITHRVPSPIIDGTNGDEVANSYNFYQKDIKALKEGGFKVYRFSISWTRVLTKNLQPNKKGIEYYNKLINALTREGIEPMVTMYHFDLPQWLEDIGGWLNPQIIKYYLQYADLLFKNFGDRVKTWITFNEPAMFCLGYGFPEKNPYGPVDNEKFYFCVHNVLIAHARAYYLYKVKYFGKQKGEIGINANAMYAYKMYPNVTDAVIDRAMQFNLGHVVHPIFIGDYPKVMKEFIGRKSKEEGRLFSRLPVFTPEEIQLINGTSDFLALNYYTSRLVAPMTGNLSDSEIFQGVDPIWIRAKSSWIFSVPEGLHDLLVWIKNNYNNVKVYVTENGWSDEPGTIKDDGRIRYLNNHLSAISRAINVEGCNVQAYTVWSLVDNFEWMMGLTERFGIFFIDFDNEKKPRVAKKSVQIFKFLTKKHFITTDWIYFRRP